MLLLRTQITSTATRMSLGMHARRRSHTPMIVKKRKVSDWIPPHSPSLTSSPLLLWDTASTAHIVGNADLLDDYTTSCSPTTVRWGTYGDTKTSVGVGTLRTRNYLPEGGETVTTFKGVLHVLGFGVNILSVKQVADKRQGFGVLFS